MIFVSVGSAFPFDRLIRTMDDWAAREGAGEEIFAQIGRGTYHPAHMGWKPSITESEFAETVGRAGVMVSHAGMGSVITALRHQTPIVLLPRRFEQGEHTTDHQMATARWLEPKNGVFVAWDEGELPAKLAEARSWTADGASLPPFAPEAFTGRIGSLLKSWVG